jgi:cell division protein FtsI/penicillin-binding protein 2
MFLLLMINVNYLQGFETASLATRPFNDRALSEANQYQRGDIVTSDGTLVAGTKLSSPNDFYKYQRYYNSGPVYAPITGYDTLYSQTGVEQAEDSLLSGNGSQLAFRNFIDMITNKQQKGATVQLTVNSKAQTAAYTGLQQALQGTDRVGGVVALNPSTGAILAMASYPSYDPNLLATHNGKQLNTNDQALLTQKPSPLLNNATQTTLPPGSTFKIVTSSAWFAQQATRTPQSNVSSPTTLTLPQTGNVLHNDNGEVCGSGSGTTTILQAFAQSCDTTFGSLGMVLGGTSLKNTADSFGMNSSVSIPGVTVAPSQYVIPPSLALTAYSAIGQFSDTATPLQEAMLSAAIANNGTLMKPYLIQQVTASDLSVVQSASPTQLSQAVSPAVANNVKQMMIAVVQQPGGTGSQFNANNEDGLEIAGKTGTAQNGRNASGLDDAVFTAFAPANNPKIAIGVMIQGGGYGAAAAAPIAVNVIKAYLASVGAGG